MLKVLVVEDDPAVAGLVQEFLDSEGFLATHGADIQSAWELLSREVPDAAVIDLGLAHGQSGWDLITQIRESETLSDLPIVVLTGVPASDAADRARDARCAYLSKPFSPAALMDRLQVAVRRVGRGPMSRPWSVALYADGVVVEGTVHVPSDLVRFSDAWEALIRDHRISIPVTDARIGGAVPAGTSELLAIRKDRITMAAPADGTTWGAGPT